MFNLRYEVDRASVGGASAVYGWAPRVAGIVVRQGILTVVLALLCFAIASQTLADEQADTQVTRTFNFGADLSDQPEYAHYQQGDGAYTTQRGFGFSFAADSPVVEGYKMLYRNRAEKGTPATPDSSVVIDVRDYGQPAKQRPPFTFRVDLPNGVYRVAVTAGDPASRLRVLAHVGDKLHSEADGALDEGAGNTKVIHDSTKMIEAGQPLVRTAEFEVTQGYLLVGFRRNTNTQTNMAAISEVVITSVDD